jgi:hypothetical protein
MPSTIDYLSIEKCQYFVFFNQKLKAVLNEYMYEMRTRDKEYEKGHELRDKLWAKHQLTQWYHELCSFDKVIWPFFKVICFFKICQAGNYQNVVKILASKPSLLTVQFMAVNVISLIPLIEIFATDLLFCLADLIHWGFLVLMFYADIIVLCIS